MSSKMLKFGLWVALFISMVAYHLSNVLSERLPHDWHAIVKVVQFASFGTIILVLMNSEFLARLLLRKKYIGGTYRGRSSDIPFERQPAPAETISHSSAADDHEEEISIRQTLLETTLTGVSRSSMSGKPKSTWIGTLFRVEEQTYWFAIELDTRYTEHGILKLVFNESGITGQYWSADAHTSVVATLVASKVVSRQPPPETATAPEEVRAATQVLSPTLATPNRIALPVPISSDEGPRSESGDYMHAEEEAAQPGNASDGASRRG